MVKQRLKGSVESFSSHIDPEREEQLKLLKIETESKVEQILKLAKSINKGNKDGNLRKKAQLIQLIENFHKHYESLYNLYDNLRGEIRQKVYIIDDMDDDGSHTSTSNSDSVQFYSPKDDDINSIDENNPKLEALHIEDYVQKDKLTSSSEVMELSKDPEVETEHSDKTVQNLLIESTLLKEIISKKNEELLSLTKKHQLHESERLTQIQELEIQIVDLKEELERVKKGGVLEVSNLKKDLKTIEIENDKLQLQLQSEKKDSLQSSNNMEKRNQMKIQELESQLVDLKQELERVKKGGACEVKNLKKDLKNIEVERNKLQQLESEKKDYSQIEELKIQLVNLKQELERVKKGEVSEVRNLKKDLKNIEIEKNKLQKKLESEKKQYLQSLNQMEKRNLELRDKVAEKKMDEMAEEFCKQFENKLQILSRRIKVAEELQLEVKEWYTNTRETYAQENKDLVNVKEMSSTTNDMLGSLDAVSLRFEECTANFMNRISKVSCELKFVKNWVMRKKKAISHVEDYQNCLLAQLDEKEAKIMVFRERVWKAENKARELGKLVKETEENILCLKEEKREAIRQLCVWTDYHRSRSDHYKKTLLNISLGCKRSTT